MRFVLSIAALSTVASALAQVQLIPKAELEKLFVGKTVTGVTPDGSRVTRSEVKPDGWMFVNNNAGFSGKAKWTLHDDDKFCWKGVGAMPDGCRVYSRQGDKIMTYDPANMATPTGFIESIK